MKRLIEITTGSLLVLVTAPAAHAQFASTYVEPWIRDCTGTPATIRQHAYGTAGGSSDRDLDADGRFEGSSVGGFNEDTDSDSIFETIQAAVDNTATGGIVHIMTPGIYRENVVTDDSVTIRGSATGDVIFEGACNATPIGAAISIGGSNKTVRLENLTIQGWEIGVDDSGGNNITITDCKIRSNGSGVDSSTSSTNTLDVIRCEIRDNVGDGIHGSQANWRIEDSIIATNDVGLNHGGTGGSSVITVTRCVVTRNVSDGILSSISSAGCMLKVHDSTVSMNGGRGIRYTGRNSGAVSVTDTLVDTNGAGGILIENNGGCGSAGASLTAIVSGCRIVGNAGDGLEIKGSGTGCTLGTFASTAKVSVFGNTISQNVGYGINPNTSGTLHCSLGHNQLSYNVAGNENGGPVCTGPSTSVNNVH